MLVDIKFALKILLCFVKDQVVCLKVEIFHLVVSQKEWWNVYSLRIFGKSNLEKLKQIF